MVRPSFRRNTELEAEGGRQLQKKAAKPVEELSGDQPSHWSGIFEHLRQGKVERFLLMVGVVASMGAPAGQAAVEAALPEATQTSIERRQDDDLLEELGRWIEEEPESVEARTLKMFWLHNAGRSVEALHMYDELMKVQAPSFLAAHTGGPNDAAMRAFADARAQHLRILPAAAADARSAGSVDPTLTKIAGASITEIHVVPPAPEEESDVLDAIFGFSNWLATTFSAGFLLYLKKTPERAGVETAKRAVEKLRKKVFTPTAEESSAEFGDTVAELARESAKVQPDDVELAATAGEDAVRGAHRYRN